MANETTTTTLTEIVNSEYVDPLMQDYAIASLNILQFARRHDLGPNKSKTWTVGIWVKDVAADKVEGTPLTNNALETNDTSITVGEIGILRELTKLASRTTIVNIEDEIARDGGQLCMEALEDDAATLLGAFSNTVGVSGQNNTVAVLLEALATLSINNARGPRVAVFHPRQAHDLIADTNAMTGTVAGANPTMQSLMNGQADGGYHGNPLFVPVWSSTLVDTANAGADRAGAVFVNGNPETGGSPGSAAIGWANLWMPELEKEPNVANSSRLFAITLAGGVGEMNDNSGVTVITDA